jgi:AcrR family transcriptional regulator
MAGVVAETGQGAGRREERKAENRAKLLAAAKKVFAEKGVGEATARDIVRETDLATGTFYNYFTDKDDCFRALLDKASEVARAMARSQRMQPGRTIEERVAGAYRAYFEWAVSERELFEVFRRNAGVITLTPGEEGMFESGITEMFEDFAEWAKAGEIPEVDFDYLASSTVAAGFQIASRLVDRDPPDVEAATRFCTRQFLGGLRALAADD